MKTTCFRLGFLLVLLFPLTALAQTSGTMTVGAVVDQTCAIQSAPNMNFGTYDTVSSNNQKNAQSIISVRCVQESTNVRLAFNQGLYASSSSSCTAPVRRMKADGKNQYLVYNLYSNAARTVVFGCAAGVNDYLYLSSVFTSAYVPVDLTVYAKLNAGQDVEAGSYKDSITISLSF